MRFGSFEVPDKDWCARNRLKYKVWVQFEHTDIGRQQQDSLIYMGFMPVGDVFPEPQDRLESDYPAIEVLEKGPWRLVTGKGVNPRLELYKITSAPDHPDEKKLVALLDATSTVAGVDGSVVVYVPYDNDSKSLTLSLDTKTKAIQLLHGDGMSITLANDKVLITNKAGDAYLVLDPEGVTLNGDVKVTGSMVVGVGLPGAAAAALPVLQAGMKPALFFKTV